MFSAETNVEVPSMGDSITEGSIAAVLKGPGDSVQVDEVIAQIETDKVTIDVRAATAGVIGKILVGEVGPAVQARPRLEKAPPGFKSST